MWNISSIKLGFLLISLLILATTTFIMISRAGLTQCHSGQKCICPDVERPSAERREDFGSSVEPKKIELAKEFEKCQEDKRELRERLDWEISRSDSRNSEESEQKEGIKSYSGVQIIVNNKRKVNGLSDSQDVYVPFSFIKQHFEIQGEYSREDNGVFEWKHAVIKRWSIPNKYLTTGEYVGLSRANVEGRKRVKCIDGMYEVPVTTQWNKNGYFYATQIAQYGLAHYSKFLIEKDGKDSVVLQSEKNLGKWAESSVVRMVTDEVTGRTVAYFDGKGKNLFFIGWQGVHEPDGKTYCYKT